FHQMAGISVGMQVHCENAATLGHDLAKRGDWRGPLASIKPLIFGDRDVIKVGRDECIARAGRLDRAVQDALGGPACKLIVVDPHDESAPDAASSQQLEGGYIPLVDDG